MWCSKNDLNVNKFIQKRGNVYHMCKMTERLWHLHEVITLHFKKVVFLS